MARSAALRAGAELGVAEDLELAGEASEGLVFGVDLEDLAFVLAGRLRRALSETEAGAAEPGAAAKEDRRVLNREMLGEAGASRELELGVLGIRKTQADFGH